MFPYFKIGLPDEDDRLKILEILTAEMRKNGKMAPDVDLKNLLVLTKYFTADEMEVLVNAACSVAMNRLIKVSLKVEVDPEDMKNNLLVKENDFIYALKNDVKPVS